MTVILNIELWQHLLVMSFICLSVPLYRRVLPARKITTIIIYLQLFQRPILVGYHTLNIIVPLARFISNFYYLGY